MKNAIHMLKSVTNVQMNSFVITTEEGGVILIDGGFEEDADYLLGYLRELTGEERPHLDAIWLSHAHRDHFTAFIRIMQKRPDAFSFDKIYFNFPSVQFLASDPDCAFLGEFYALMPKFADKIVIVSGGDKYFIRGAEFDVLYSPDCEITQNVCNNSSIVFRMTLGGKTTLFLGDCGIEAGNKLIRMYGDRLKSDICQMAHHGQNGVTREFYEIVKPGICLWCAPDWLWNNDAGQGYNTYIFNTVKTRGWMDEISPGHRDVVLMNGTQVTEL